MLLQWFKLITLRAHTQESLASLIYLLFAASPMHQTHTDDNITHLGGNYQIVHRDGKNKHVGGKTLRSYSKWGQPY
jgi:hypothetical protein